VALGRHVLRLLGRGQRAAVRGHHALGRVRPAPQPRLARVLAPAGRHRPLRPRRRLRAGRPGHGARDAARVPRAARRPRRGARPLHRADGRGHLVGQRRRDARFPGSDLRALLPQPRPADLHGPAGVADGAGRQPLLREGLPRPLPRQGAPGGGREVAAAPGGGRRGADDGRGLGALRPRRRGVPRGRGPRAVERPVPRRETPPRSVEILQERHLAPHGYVVHAAQPARLGIVELPPLRGGGCPEARLRHVRHEPSPRPPCPKDISRHAEPAARTGPQDGIETHRLPPPRLRLPRLRSQAELPSLNGARSTWFCGSYFGYGFHEDAVQSALRVAAAFARRPQEARL
jgi:hypothetical protein